MHDSIPDEAFNKFVAHNTELTKMLRDASNKAHEFLQDPEVRMIPENKFPYVDENQQVINPAYRWLLSNLNSLIIENPGEISNGFELPIKKLKEALFAPNIQASQYVLRDVMSKNNPPGWQPPSNYCPNCGRANMWVWDESLQAPVCTNGGCHYQWGQE